MKKLFLILFALLILPALTTFGQNNPSSYEPTFVTEYVYDLNSDDGVTSICKNKNDFLIAGSTGDSIFSAFIMKINDQGTRQWTWTGPDNTYARGIATLSDNSYIYGLNSIDTSGIKTGMLAGLDTNGNQTWQITTGLYTTHQISVDGLNQKVAVTAAQSGNDIKIFDTQGSLVDEFPLDNNYYVKNSITLKGDYLLVSGNLYDTVGVYNIDGFIALYQKVQGIWQKQWQDNVIDAVNTQSIMDENMNIYVAGHSMLTDEYITRKYDLSGNIIWEKTFPHPVLGQTYSMSLLPDNKGVVVGIVISGTTVNYGGVYSYDQDGNMLFNFDLDSNTSSYIIGIKFDTNSNLCLVGSVGEYGQRDIFIQIWSIDGITSVDIEPNFGNLPIDFSLSQNYPNPFNPSTQIEFTLPQSEQVVLKVFNSLGQEVETLVNEIMPPGKYSVKFNAENLASGMYIYQIRAGDFNTTKKMLLTK